MSAFLVAEDFAKNPGLPLESLEKFLDDVDYQPSWRAEADRAADYYDGNQLTPDMIAEMERRGQPVLVHNLIAAAIDGVLGAEAKTRTQWQVTADNDEYKDMAEALNMELNEAARLTIADRGCADAYAAQVKTGLGWVEVNRNTDPFKYKYRVNYVHRREIFWDWHSKLPDLSDARWLLRQKWLDEDEAVMMFPKHKEIIRALAGGWSSSDLLSAIQDSPDLQGAYNDYSVSNLNFEEYWDSTRRRLKIFEVYYRVYERKPVLKTQDGEAIVYDPQNRFHVAIVASGRADIVMEPYAVMRMAYFLGPHRVHDQVSPHPHNHFPYVPFFGFREDKSDVPYGLIRRMMPAQDEINHRRSKLTALLNKYRIVKDHDALHNMSDEDLLDELSRDDTIINLNKDKNFKIEQEFNLVQQQFSVLQDSVSMVRDTAGIYNAFLGQDSSASSGVAIDSLVEQGSTTLGELNDNYRYSRQLVGNLLLHHIVQDLGEKMNHKVRVTGQKSSKAKDIVLNEVTQDESGRQVISNRVVKTKAQVVLADITSTPGYRAQQRYRLMDLAAKLDPETARLLIPFIIEDSDVPNQDDILKMIRKTMGHQPDTEDMDDQELQQYQKEQEEAQAQFDAQMAEVEARLSKLQGEARKVNAEASEVEQKSGLIPLDAEKTQAETQLLYTQMKKIVTDVVEMRRTMMERVDKTIQAESKQQKLLTQGMRTIAA